MWETTGLENESDVEQKFLFPLMTEPSPLGFGIPPSVIQTKVSIRRFAIGKGSDQKLYFPDYLVVEYGFPIVVIEAKHPKESVEEGYRQARLYAAELNALFPSGVTVSKFLIASNGVELWYGYADTAEPLGRAQCVDLGPYSKDLARMLDLMSWGRISEIAREVAQSLRPSDLYKPRRLLGGQGVQNEEVGQNAFGATLTAEISTIFNPDTEADRAFIAKHGYVSSRRRERYVEPIDKIIRAARPLSETDAIELADSANPSELLSRLRKTKDLEHKVLLLIGSVGSGKSTFIDYLRQVALPRDIVSSTVWCRMDMNSAPVSAQEIYPWLRKEIIAGCRAAIPEDDFDDWSIIQKVYSVEINKFKKGVGQLYKDAPVIHAQKLGEEVQVVQADLHASANAHVRYVCGDRGGKLFVVVLDNCDKKTRDEQLLMFEAAQWLQREFRCLVILPLRDETYDNHRNQPPLDTALKDLVFRIEPPMFQQVLVSRVQLALQKLSGNGNEKLTFTLGNGFVVSYARSDQTFYLSTIIRSLFEHDRFVRRMIVGLSGRNIRRALEIFLEFCNSGHISEDQIFKIRQSEGAYTLPLAQVTTVLLRMNRRYYDSDHSYVKNVFAAAKDDPLPGYFARYMILRWLRNKFSSAGTNGLQGYFPKRLVKSALMPHGFSPDSLDREFNYLLEARCIIAEHLRLDVVDDEDLIRIGPSGFVHLDLVGNVNYLAAVAEDTFFSDRLQAERVAERIRDGRSHRHIQTALENASELTDFLDLVRKTYRPSGDGFMGDDLLESLAVFDDAHNAILRAQKTFNYDPWLNAERRYTRNSIHIGQVVNATNYGRFVEFRDGLVGLAHNDMSGDVGASPGDTVEAQILWVDAQRQRMSLRLRRVLAEETGDEVPGIHGAQTPLPFPLQS